MLNWATWVLLTLAGGSALTDLLYNKIYNALVVPAAVLGLVLAGASQMGERMTTMLLVLMLLLPFWMCLPESIGGGDIKLYLAMAALLPRNAFLILLILSLAGAGGIGLLRRLWPSQTARHLQAERIRIGPAVLCAALMYAGGLYG